MYLLIVVNDACHFHRNADSTIDILNVKVRSIHCKYYLCYHLQYSYFHHTLLEIRQFILYHFDSHDLLRFGISTFYNLTECT
jgi:hypothetical protein